MDFPVRLVDFMEKVIFLGFFLGILSKVTEKELQARTQSYSNLPEGHFLTTGNIKRTTKRQISPLHKIALLRPKASAVDELMCSTMRCFIFFMTMFKIQHIHNY